MWCTTVHTVQCLSGMLHLARMGACCHRGTPVLLSLLTGYRRGWVHCPDGSVAAVTVAVLLWHQPFMCADGCNRCGASWQATHYLNA